MIPSKTPSAYTMYERSNVIVSSKYATPEHVETQTPHNVIAEEIDVYVQRAKAQTTISRSSLSSSQ